MAIISIDKLTTRFAINRFKSNVSTTEDIVSSSKVGDISEDSQVLKEYGESLEAVLSMLNSLTELLANDVASYDKALEKIIEKDNFVPSQLKAQIN